MVTLAKQRIKDVFNDSLENVRKGKRANISRNMIKRGYSLSSAKCLKVTKTKTWELLHDSLREDLAVDTFNELAKPKNTDKRTRMDASREILKLKNRYPKEQIDIDLRGKREEIITAE